MDVIKLLKERIIEIRFKIDHPPKMLESKADEYMQNLESVLQINIKFLNYLEGK